MTDEMMAAIEARMALQDARIRALHDGFRVMAEEVDKLRTRVDRGSEDLDRADGAVTLLAGDLAELRRAVAP